MAAFLPSAAAAAPVTWTLQDARFAGSGPENPFSGSFAYDADTNTYSAINITTRSGGGYVGATYSFGVNGTASRVTLLTSSGDNTGLKGLYLLFDSPLTGAGGTVALDVTGSPTTARTMEAICSTPNCSNLNLPSARYGFTGVVNGAVAAAAVPTLSEWAMIMFGTILAGAAALYIQRRRSA